MKRKYEEINGDLFEYALKGKFDVICQGNNCFNTQNAGIAVRFKEEFETNNFELEQSGKGDYNKLGQIDYEEFEGDSFDGILAVVNCYTQFNPGPDGNYAALTLCLSKINYIFKGRHIGLPQIGCGIAGLDWNEVKEIIKEELVDCDVTVVIFKQ